MARRQQVYTARVKRADDGAQDAKIKKKRTGEPEDGALPAKTRPRREAAAPEKDAAAFSGKALACSLVLVPSDTFGVPGYFRIAYCTDTARVERSLEAFRRLVRTEYGGCL